MDYTFRAAGAGETAASAADPTLASAGGPSTDATSASAAGAIAGPSSGPIVRLSGTDIRVIQTLNDNGRPNITNLNSSSPNILNYLTENGFRNLLSLTEFTAKGKRGFGFYGDNVQQKIISHIEGTDAQPFHELLRGSSDLADATLKLLPLPGVANERYMHMFFQVAEYGTEKDRLYEDFVQKKIVQPILRDDTVPEALFEMLEKNPYLANVTFKTLLPIHSVGGDYPRRFFRVASYIESFTDEELQNILSHIPDFDDHVIHPDLYQKLIKLKKQKGQKRATATVTPEEEAKRPKTEEES